MFSINDTPTFKPHKTLKFAKKQFIKFHAIPLCESLAVYPEPVEGSFAVYPEPCRRGFAVVRIKRSSRYGAYAPRSGRLSFLAPTLTLQKVLPVPLTSFKFTLSAVEGPPFLFI